MNDNKEAPNPMLRAHVTDHSFVLALKKTHIIMLIAIANNERPQFDYHNDWVTPAHGLKKRGLLLHCTDVFGRSGSGIPQQTFQKWDKADPPISCYYRLTKAGWAVYDLLVESGFALEVARNKRKMVA